MRSELCYNLQRPWFFYVYIEKYKNLKKKPEKIWKNSEKILKKLRKSRHILKNFKKYKNNFKKCGCWKEKKFLVFYCDFAPFDVSWVFRSCIQRNGWPACLLSTKSYTQQASHFFHAFMHLSSDISFFEMPAFSIQD